MKAALVREYTALDNAEYTRTDDPEVSAGKVLVDIEAIEVHFPNVLYLEGEYKRRPELPFAPGPDAIGREVTVEVGAQDISFRDTVLVLPEHGTYAEKIFAPECHRLPVPADIPSIEVAAFVLAYQTAFFDLIYQSGLREGDSVFGLAATGGGGDGHRAASEAVGSGGVIPATRGDKGEAFARELDGIAMVDASIENLRNGMCDAVHAATRGEGADVVINPVGRAASVAALSARAWRGQIVVVGFALRRIPQISANYLQVKSIPIGAVQWTDCCTRVLERVAEAQKFIFGLRSKGLLHPVLNQTFPLEKYADALRQVKIGTARRKLVLTCNNAAGDSN